jgi:AcrR family transcriptional regulator
MGSMANTALPARQGRSRESVERLVQATIGILNKDGLEGATIPRIAARAGLAAGTVYRRFPDKDALLREVCLRLVEQNALAQDTWLSPERWPDSTLRELCQSLVARVIRTHAEHHRLILSLGLFATQDGDAAFVKKIHRMQQRSLQRLAELLLTRRQDICHPHPEAAVYFALLSLFMTVQGVYVLPTMAKPFRALLPDVDARLQRELPLLLLRYLGIET